MKRIEKIDLTKQLDKKQYKEQLKQLQFELLNIQQFLFEKEIALILVFEGMDAAGKGGAIKRLTERLDPRGFVVHPISAPKFHEKRYHYLQRFWRKIPQHGQIGIFDRSWYGRVLVERIEGFATDKEWQRAYEELNSFEKKLTDEYYILLKFWIHIDKDEQLIRFQNRQNDPYKQWKLTDEDWKKLTMAMGSLSNSGIFIDDTPGIRISEIRAKCRRLKQEHGLGLVVIDYLQLIQGSGRVKENRQQEVSEISRSLKALARELEVPVIALSQLSRGVEQRQDKRPMMSDIRESGSIEQDADIVAFLYRDDYYNKDSENKNIIEIIIAKQRNGPVGTVQLAFAKEYNKFVNLDRRFDDASIPPGA